MINLSFLFIVNFLVMVIFNSTFTLLPLYILKLGGTEFHSGLQTALFFITAICLRFYFGPLADRVGRKIPLLIGTACFALTSLLFYYSNSLWLLTLARMLQALGLSAFLSSSISAVADMAPVNKVGTYMGVYRLIGAFALLVGPATSSFIMNQFSFGFWFMTCFLFGLIALILLFKTQFVEITQSTNLRISNSMLSVLLDKKYWAIYLGIGLTATSFGALLSFVTLYISRVTEISNPGIYFTFFGIASIFSTLISGHLSDRWGRSMVAWPAIGLLGLGVSILYYLDSGQYTILIISSLLTGIGFNGGISVLSAWLVDLSPVSTRATVLSVQESIIDFSIGLIALALGSLSSSIDFSISFLFTGLIVVVFAISLIIRTNASSATTLRG